MTDQQPIPAPAESRRPGFFRYYVRGSVVRALEDDALFLASGIAFNILFCVIPLMILTTWLFGTILNASDAMLKSAVAFVNNAFPDQPHTVAIRRITMRLLHDLVAFRQPLGWFGFFLLIFASSSLFSAVRSALFRVHHIRGIMNPLLGQLKDMLFVISLGILFIIVNALSWIYTLSIHAAVQFYGPGVVQLGPAIPLFLRTVASIFFTMLLAYLAYRFIPLKGSDSHSAVLAAGTSTVLWTISSQIFAYYLASYHPFTELYGTYAFLVVALVWIYFTSLVFVLGAIVGVLYRERHQQSAS